MKNQLIKRWQTTKIQELKMIKDAVKKGGNIVSRIGFELDKIDGKWDFRGIEFEFREFKRIKGCNFKDVDFSYCSFDQLWLEKNTFENCLFNNSSFKGVPEIGNDFTNAVFSETDFTKAILGYDGSRYVNCNFINVKMKGTDFIRAEFDDCNFINCKLRKIDFNASSFNNCTFEGSLDEVWFRGGFPTLMKLEEEFGKPRPNKMLNVDFSKSSFYAVEFTDFCDLTTVKLPENVYYFPEWAKIFNEFEKRLAEWDEKDQKEGEIFADVFRVHVNTQPDNIIDRAYVDKSFGKKVMDTLLEIRKELFGIDVNRSR